MAETYREVDGELEITVVKIVSKERLERRLERAQEAMRKAGAHVVRIQAQIGILIT